MSLADPTPLHPFLDKLLSRSDLSAEEQQTILDLPARPEQIETNRDFVRLGERTDHACFVVAGLVGRFGQSRNGNRQITAVHIPADMVDLHSVVAPDACSALQALSVTTILRVPHVALRAAAHRFPAIAEAFWRECVVDAAVLSEWVVNVGRRNARARIAHLLCEIACRSQGMANKDGSSIPFPATQTHIADMTGLTSVHVNRTLQSLSQEGIVDLYNRQIHVRDWAGMTRAGDFDPTYLWLAKAASRMN
ncbi:MAG TPA: Crp/Fnr family transcriptional regulator [Allosphingosinicella sp.]|nr:Crp/Fnr family transcriptional regulator [Allosphingosinicella sp.]